MRHTGIQQKTKGPLLLLLFICELLAFCWPLRLSGEWTRWGGLLPHCPTCWGLQSFVSLWWLLQLWPHSYLHLHVLGSSEAQL